VPIDALRLVPSALVERVEEVRATVASAVGAGPG
jgi:hypothetical protein